MEQVRQACDVARRLCAALDDAITSAKDLSAPMARLESQPLFAAAARRTAVNVTIADLVSALGEALRSIAASLGWTELTMERLKLQAPADATLLDAELADIRRRAAILQKLDETNRVRGSRALRWMRVLVAGHTGQVVTSAYNRRGTLAPSLTLSTASRRL